MSIEKYTRTIVRYRATCDTCKKVFPEAHNERAAEWDLRSHNCGEHRPEHDSTGGYRGILGGFSVRCVCGSRWVVDRPGTPFSCPDDPRNESNSNEQA